MIGLRIAKPKNDDWKEYMEVSQKCNESGGKYFLKDCGDFYEVCENEIPLKDKLMDEANEIEQWFTWYDLQVSQFGRCERLGIKFDKDMTQLDLEAIEKSMRLKEINKKLEDLQSK